MRSRERCDSKYLINFRVSLAGFFVALASVYFLQSTFLHFNHLFEYARSEPGLSFHVGRGGLRQERIYTTVLYSRLGPPHARGDRHSHTWHGRGRDTDGGRLQGQSGKAAHTPANNKYIHRLLPAGATRRRTARHLHRGHQAATSPAQHPLSSFPSL